jgi:hypothetical protein
MLILLPFSTVENEEDVSEGEGAEEESEDEGHGEDAEGYEEGLAGSSGEEDAEDADVFSEPSTSGWSVETPAVKQKGSAKKGQQKGKRKRVRDESDEEELTWEEVLASVQAQVGTGQAADVALTVEEKETTKDGGPDGQEKSSGLDSWKKDKKEERAKKKHSRAKKAA